MENDSNYSDSRIGKVLAAETDAAEPVLTVVAEKDKEVGGIATDRLLSFVERIERLNEEKRNISKDISQVFGEAKGAGFDVKAMRQVIKLRSLDAAARQEEDYLLETYRRALDL